MDSVLSEESLWANNLSARLRLVQANFADDQAAVRSSFINDEIERALKGISGARRESYLNALAQKFPLWESSAPVTVVQQTPDTDDSPDLLLARLIKASEGLAPEAKAELGRKLQKAGLLPPQKANPIGDIPPEMQKRLGLAAGQPLDPERTVKLVGALLELVLTLDQLIWTLWKQVAPKSTIRKEVDIAKIAGQFVIGSPDVSTPQVIQSLERTRKLIAGLLGAVGRAGADYARKHAARFAPEVIEDFAKMEGGWASSEVKCWRKYVQLAKEHATEPAIEGEIQEAIARAAENLAVGRNS